MTSASDIEKAIVDFCARHAKKPYEYSCLAYRWGEGDLAGSTGPRLWQKDVLQTIGKHLQNPATRFHPLQIAIASGHDIGKSALISMIVQWAESTCADTKVVVTANTDTQLRTKTWPEITKWFRLAINSHWFKVTATAVTSAAPEHERTWRADAIPWSENNTEAFAGLHNKGRRIVLVFDEGSAIADKIFEVAEGALIDEDTEIIWLVFGNPTRNTGRFRECFGKLKHRWVNKQIDSRTVEGTNKQKIQELVEDYGEDSDFVRIRVKGEFPRAGTTQFIAGDVVDRARRIEAFSTLQDPFVLGVDVARFGDDESVLVPRRGRDARSIPWETFKGADTMQLAARVNELHTTHRFDAIFVDGGGVGGGVIDRLRMLGLPVIEVQFGGSADRGVRTGEGPVMYANKRAEIWGSMRDGLRAGLAVPDDPDLGDQLTGVEYGYILRDGKDAVLLESKKDMKKRGLSSPDKADALALTYAYPVQPSDHSAQMSPAGKGTHTIDYDPFDRTHRK